METKNTTDFITEIKKIISEQLGIEISDITDEKIFETDFNADGLDIVEMWIEIEEKLDISISDDEIDQTKTVEDMIKIAEAAKTKIKKEKNLDTTSTILLIIKEQLNCKMSEITTASNLENDLGADSLDKMGIFAELEVEFKIKISEKEWKAFETVGDIITYVTNKIEKK